MPNAPTQSNPSGEGNTNPQGGNNGGTPPTTGAGDGPTPPASNNAVDLKTLPADQLAQVLENPNLWQQPRIKEMLEAQRKLKEHEQNAQKQSEEQLKEQNKFKELSEKQADTIAQLNAKLETGTLNQALTNKLATMGVVDLEAALALIDRSKLSIDETSGSVNGVDEAIEALKTGKSYLFTAGGGQSPSVGGPTNPQNGTSNTGTPTFKRSQLRDPKFYQEHRADILKAQAEGLIEDDVS